MIKTDDIFKMVQDEVDTILQKEPTIDKLVGEMKKTVVTAMTKKGITVDDSINVSAKLIVLASMVRA
jgi:hypothetical protein